MRPIKPLMPYHLSSPDCRTVTTSIQKKTKQIVRFCLFLLYSYSSDVYIHVLPVLCFYSHTVRIKFFVYPLLIIKENQTNNDDHSFFFRFRLLNLCNACLLFFCFIYIYCVILHLIIIDQNKKNKPCVCLCGAIIPFFFLSCIEQRIIRTSKKKQMKKSHCRVDEDLSYFVFF